MTTTTTGHPAAGPAHRVLSALSVVTVVLPLAALAWFVGMLPRIVSRSTGTTLGSVGQPSALTTRSLLVWDYQQLVVTLVLAFVGGAAAGLTTRWCSRPEGRRRELVTLVSAGAGLAVALAVVLALRSEPGQPAWTLTRSLLKAGVLGVPVLATAGGLAVGLLVALGSATVRVVACAVLAAVLAVWAELLVAAVASSDHAPVAPAGSLASLVAGVVLGGVLARAGLSGRARVVAWAGASALLVLTPAVLLGVGHTLERLHGVRSDLGPLLGEGLQVTADRLAQPAPYGPAAVAVVVALAVTVRRRRTHAS